MHSFCFSKAEASSILYEYQLLFISMIMYHHTSIYIKFLMKRGSMYRLLILLAPILVSLMSNTSIGATIAERPVIYVGFAKTNPFWIVLGQAVTSTAEKAKLPLIDMTAAQENDQNQVQAIEMAINKNSVGMILGVGSSTEPLREPLSRLKNANIPVIAVDTDFDHPAVSASVSTDNYSAAKMAGEYISKRASTAGTVLILGGTQGHPNGEARMKGAADSVKAHNMKIIEKYGNWNEEQAFMITKATIQKEGQIAAVFAANDPMIIGAMQAINSLNLKRRPLLVGFDAITPALELISKGKIDATVAQQPELIGKEGVGLLKSILNGKKVPRHKLIPGVLVTKSNVAEYLKR
jgi:ribose transport system substrate-binding protein